MRRRVLSLALAIALTSATPVSGASVSQTGYANSNMEHHVGCLLYAASVGVFWSSNQAGPTAEVYEAYVYGAVIDTCSGFQYLSTYYVQVPPSDVNLSFRGNQFEVVTVTAVGSGVRSDGQTLPFALDLTWNGRGAPSLTHNAIDGLQIVQGYRYADTSGSFLIDGVEFAGFAPLDYLFWSSEMSQ